MLSRYLRVLVVLFIACVAAAQASAQKLPGPTLDSLDFDVMNSDTIAIGTAKIDEAQQAYYDRPLTVEVSETLRGEFGKQITGKVRTERPRFPTQGAKVLVFADRNAPMIRAYNLDDPKISASTSDFKILRGPDAILKYVRDAVRKNPSAKKLPSSPSWPPDNAVGHAWSKEFHDFLEGGLIVPADEKLQKHALEAVHSQDRSTVYHAASALKLFKSDADIERMKALLKDPYYIIILKAEAWNGTEYRFYPARQAAVDVLRAWEVSFTEPVTNERISRVATIKSLHVIPSSVDGGVPWLKDAKQLETLDIPYGTLSEDEFSAIGSLTRLKTLTLIRMHMDDRVFEKLAGLTNLRTLTIDKNPITDQGLNVLRHFPHLKEVSLYKTQVTEAGIAALKKARPDLKVITVKVEE